MEYPTVTCPLDSLGCFVLPYHRVMLISDMKNDSLLLPVASEYFPRVSDVSSVFIPIVAVQTNTATRLFDQLSRFKSRLLFTQTRKFASLAMSIC